MRLEDRVEQIREEFEQERYTLAAKEAASVIEHAFRDIYRKTIIGEISGKARQKAFEVEQKIGGPSKTLENFTLGQIWQLFREAKLFREYSEATGHQLRAITMIDFDSLISLRNDLQHGGYEATRAEAQLCLFSLENMLEAFGILSLETTGTPTSRSSEPLVGDLDPGLKNSPESQGTPLKYSPTRGDERARLNLQYQLFSPLFEHLKEVQEKRWGRFESAIDIGCADGSVSREWLGGCRNVIGIDIDIASIEQAQLENDVTENFVFFQCDIEESLAGDQLTEILQELPEPEAPLLALLSLSLHHFSAPVRVLKMLRRTLPQGSLLMILTPDQGMSLAYPGDTFEEIKSLSSQAPVHRADGEHGRKLLEQLLRAGFRNQYVVEYPFTIFGLDSEERFRLFSVFNSFRSQIWERAREAGDPEAASAVERMEELLEALEVEFQSPSFFFHAAMFGALAEV